MKVKVFTAISVALAMLLGIQLVHSQANEQRAINEFIARRAKNEDAEEYPSARKILRADVNGDHKTDVIVLYTLEGFGGGNNYQQYLAIFLGGGRSFKNNANVVAGGKLHRTVELRSVAAGVIHLGTLSYRKNDPACCPTRKGSTGYRYLNGKLKEER
jgi:hypothetical protein